jgi:actin cytoskeleton-regulatory complex protein END3
VPPSLRASWASNNIDYSLGGQQTSSSYAREAQSERDAANDTPTGRKAKFGDTYLSRLGRGGGYTPARGTDFSNTKATTEDWEEVRLKKQLAELEAKMEKVEANASKRKGGRRDDSKPALVKRELEQLLDYKRREIRELEKGEGKAKGGMAIRELEKEVEAVREQVEGLEGHLRSREAVLEGLKAEIEREKLK